MVAKNVLSPFDLLYDISEDKVNLVLSQDFRVIFKLSV